MRHTPWLARPPCERRPSSILMKNFFDLHGAGAT